MKLHVFNDPHGFVLNLTIKRVIRYSPSNQHIFINLTEKTVYKNGNVIYLKKNLKSYRKAIKELPTIDTLTLYPLDFTSAWFLKEFRKRFSEVPAGWVFWSYEYYHRPDMYPYNLDRFSLKYYRQKQTILSRAKEMFKDLLKRSLSRPVFDRKLLNESYKQVNAFYSFLPRDFKNVFSAIPGNNYSYHQFSFLSIEEISAGISKDNRLTQQIMIGHSASLSGNHAEILNRLAVMDITNDFFIPLEYGDKGYGKEIKEMVTQLWDGKRVQFLEERLEMQAYYQRIAGMGYAIFNFRWQEGLGNILFLVWNGAKVFLKEESSVYQQFEQWGLNVFSIEKDLHENSLANLLPSEKATENRRILETLFSEAKLNQYWQSLM